MLGEVQSWHQLVRVSKQLDTNAEALKEHSQLLSKGLRPSVTDLVALASSTVVQIDAVRDLLSGGDISRLRLLLENFPRPSHRVRDIGRELRARNQPAALCAINVIAGLLRAAKLFDKLSHDFSVSFVAVQGRYGCGKTELAATLTAKSGDRPAGVLLRGRDLPVGGSLDDLARRITIHGRPLPSMESLVAAVDAAAQRGRHRLPIAIDGLNEAEDPRDWKGLLASLPTILRDYPLVLFVCTLRPSVVEDALPEGTPLLEISDFGFNAEEAVERYFNHYRIDAADAELPWDLLRHPLSLWLFCEVANPTRTEIVGTEALPRSLTGLLERYLDQVASRIADLSPSTARYYAHDVRSALAQIGWMLWSERTRFLDLNSLRQSLNDADRHWNQSLVSALEENGVLQRLDHGADGKEFVAPNFDALAGHLAAEALLDRIGQTGIEASINEGSFVASLVGEDDQHPIADDVLRSLVGLCPRRLDVQLWPLLKDPLQTRALVLSAELEASYIDSKTAQRLMALVAKPAPGHPDILDRLRFTRGSQDHPLNAHFLEAALRPMDVAARDLRWTEWVRHREEEVIRDLTQTLSEMATTYRPTP